MLTTFATISRNMLRAAGRNIANRSSRDLRQGLRSLPRLLRLEDRVNPVSVNNVLVNNPSLDTGTADNQSETSTIVYGSTILSFFNDFAYTENGDRSSGYAISTNGGDTFEDLNYKLPVGSFDQGDPSIARDSKTGRLYYGVLRLDTEQITSVGIFRSDDNGTSWLPPTNGMPNGSSFHDKEWVTVDNHDGPGRGNVYIADRDSANKQIWFSRSEDQGGSFLEVVSQP